MLIFFWNFSFAYVCVGNRLSNWFKYTLRCDGYLIEIAHWQDQEIVLTLDQVILKWVFDMFWCWKWRKSSWVPFRVQSSEISMNWIDEWMNGKNKLLWNKSRKYTYTIYRNNLDLKLRKSMFTWIFYNCCQQFSRVSRNHMSRMVIISRCISAPVTYSFVMISWIQRK